MPCGEVVGEAVEAILGAPPLEAGWEGEGAAADAVEGMVRGGATGVSAAFIAGSALTSSVFCDRGLTTSSEARGGVSDSGLREAGGAMVEGLPKPARFVFSDRRLILGFSAGGSAKLSSPGSGCVAGI
ncbi:MAG TPA: hypothetical protein VGZ93_09735 [Candidatus Methylacidiphilales bacterium]|nr:hypothetical protein [Candidatus Methylacidiphilales bacterium]